jgi:hypothetical protein
MICCKFRYACVFILLTELLSCGTSGKESGAGDNNSVRQDSINTAKVIQYLRNNFDDIHDVSMRYHHLDHTLNGLIVLRLTWRDGHLYSGQVLQNETGNENFAQAFIEKIRSWSIPDIRNSFEMNLPLRIRIVGSDNPEFNFKSIFTGEVFEQNGTPVSNARLQFIPVSNPNDSIAACYANREGIFVRTLIPPGTWNVICTRDGFETASLNNYVFSAGEHHRHRFILNRD